MRDRHCENALSDAGAQALEKVAVVGILDDGRVYFRTSMTSTVDVMELLSVIMTLLLDAPPSGDISSKSHN